MSKLSNTIGYVFNFALRLSDFESSRVSWEYMCEGHFTHWKKRTKFFLEQKDLYGFFLKTKGLLPKVYEIFGSEMPFVMLRVRVCITHMMGGFSGQYIPLPL